MSIFRKKYTRFYAAMQSAKGVPATLTGADAIFWLYESPFMKPMANLVDRGLGPVGSWPSAIFAVGQWGEGSINLEIRGSGTAGTEPEISPFFETLLGTKHTNSAGTVDAGTGSTSGFGSSTVFAVGQLARVDVSAGADDSAFEVRRIATVSEDGDGTYTYTVARNFSAAPQDGATIAAGVSYQHLGTEDPGYFTALQYQEKLRLYCPDAACKSLDLTVDSREVVKGVFGLHSLTATPSDATDSLTPSYNQTNPLGGVLCNLVRDGIEYEMKSMSMNIATRRSRGGINSPGYSDLPWLGTFDATVTMAPWVEDASIFTEFLATETVSAEMTKGIVPGNIFHLETAGLQHTGPEIGEEEGDNIWNDQLTITGGVYVGFF